MDFLINLSLNQGFGESSDFKGFVRHFRGFQGIPQYNPTYLEWICNGFRAFNPLKIHFPCNEKNKISTVSRFGEIAVGNDTFGTRWTWSLPT